MAGGEAYDPLGLEQSLRAARADKTEYGSPRELGIELPRWRPGQQELVMRAAAGERRFLLLSAPTGVGKSVVALGAAMAVHRYHGGLRSVVLTRTRQLQQQYLSLRVLDEGKKHATVRLTGKRGYVCILPGAEGRDIESAPCQVSDYDCPLRRSRKGRPPSCPYYRHLALSRGRPVVVANYDLWFYNLDRLDDLGLSDLGLIACDEAHSLVTGDTYARARSVHLDPRDAQEAGLVLRCFGRVEEYQRWAVTHLGTVRRAWEEAGEQLREQLSLGRYDQELARRAQGLRRLLLGMERLAAIADPSGWVVTLPYGAREGDVAERYPVSLVPALGGDLREALYRHARRVLLMSATLLPTRETAELLGIRPDECDILDLPSPFPVENRPVYYWPVDVLTRENMERHLRTLVQRVDYLAARHLPERGIVHVPSFTLARQIQSLSRYGDQMVLHGQRDRTEVIERWLDREGPPILVSPSCHEGVDGKDDRCRWQVVAKIPWPDKEDPVWRRRLEHNRSLYEYGAISTLVQSCGRGVRHEQDYCATYVLDGWLGVLLEHRASLFPAWFLESLRTYP